jgi:hypothetical protein
MRVLRQRDAAMLSHDLPNFFVKANQKERLDFGRLVIAYINICRAGVRGGRHVGGRTCRMRCCGGQLRRLGGHASSEHPNLTQRQVASS